MKNRHIFTASVISILCVTQVEAQQWGDAVQFADTFQRLPGYLPNGPVTNLALQVDSTSCPSGTSLPAFSPSQLGVGSYAILSSCRYSGSLLVNIDQFARQGDVSSLQAQLTSQFAAINSQLNRALDGAAMGIAMKDAIPNGDDRYALRVNFGGFDSHAAGGVAFTAKFSDSFRVMVNYGQSRSQSAFSGGLNFSFD